MSGRAWLLAAFALGIALGISIERFRDSSHEVPRVAAAANSASSSLPAAPVVYPAATPVPAPQRARQAEAPGATPAPTALADAAAAQDAAEYTGYVLPIDVGPAFRKEVAAQSVPGNENHMGDAHRALEREMRDDSWSYPLEADIQNSLVADTSMGNFKVEHLECRATLCEIRLSAQGGEQTAALSKWSDNMHTLPWASRAVPISRSMVSGNGQMDELVILQKPPKPAPKN
jgi:hypothetical protein